MALCLRKTRSVKSHNYRDAPVSKCFLSTRKRKASVLKIVPKIRKAFTKSSVFITDLIRITVFNPCVSDCSKFSFFNCHGGVGLIQII